MTFVQRPFASLLLISCALVSYGTAQAGPFDEADRLFDAREDSIANSEAAIAEYSRTLDTVRDGDLAYAVQQIAKASVYLGEYLVPERDRARKARIFQNCREKAKLLEPHAALVTEYSYWRLACSSLWMKFASLADRLSELPVVRADFNRLIGDDLEVKPEMGVDLRYHSGGMMRVLGNVYINSLANLIRDDLPNEAKGLEMVNRALGSSNFPGDPNWGLDYYRNHRTKAEVLIALGRDDDAEILLEETIEEIDERIEDDDLPLGIEPETKEERLVMIGMLSELRR